MTPDRFSAADVDGTFCIQWTTTDFSEPRIIANYWPTTLRTRDVLRFFFDNADDIGQLAQLHCVQSMPGEYYIGTKQEGFRAPWKQGQHVRLLHGSATQPIKTDVAEAPAPKVRKGTLCYWSGGVWVKHSKSKGPERINPLD